MASAAAASSAADLEAVAETMHGIVSRDEGGRGIANLVVPGDMFAAATAFVRADVIALLTGFPCVVEPPFAENDGLAGTAALSRAARALGKRVVLMSDKSCAEGIVALLPHLDVDAATVTGTGAGDSASVGSHTAADPELASLGKSEDVTTIVVSDMVKVMLFPAGESWTPEHADSLEREMERVEHVVAVERAGAASDGDFYTMKGRSMKHLVAPLDSVVDIVQRQSFVRDGKTYSATMTGIGDGGNELGMGKLSDVIHRDIPQGETIGAAKKADHLIAASVSNWGSYALAATVAAISVADKGDHVRRPGVVVPSILQETSVQESLMTHGIKDGVLQKVSNSVDGIPFSETLSILKELHAQLDVFASGEA